MTKGKRVLWIIVSEGKLSSSENLRDAVTKFESLESFVVNESKIIELQFNAKESTFTIEEVPLRTIANEMMEEKKK